MQRGEEKEAESNKLRYFWIIRRNFSDSRSFQKVTSGTPPPLSSVIPKNIQALIDAIKTKRILENGIVYIETP